MLDLESGVVVLSFGGAVGGFSLGRFCFFFWRVSFTGVLGISPFSSFTFLLFVGV